MSTTKKPLPSAADGLPFYHPEEVLHGLLHKTALGEKGHKPWDHIDGFGVRLRPGVGVPADTDSNSFVGSCVPSHVVVAVVLRDGRGSQRQGVRGREIPQLLQRGQWLGSPDRPLLHGLFIPREGGVTLVREPEFDLGATRKTIAEITWAAVFAGGCGWWGEFLVVSGGLGLILPTPIR
jgi:hypothetical protein